MSEEDPLLNGKESLEEQFIRFYNGLKAIRKALDPLDNQEKFVVSGLRAYIKIMEEYREQISGLLEERLENIDVRRFEDLLKCIRHARLDLKAALEELDEKKQRTKKYHRCLTDTVETIEKYLPKK